MERGRTAIREPRNQRSVNARCANPSFRPRERTESQRPVNKRTSNRVHTRDGKRSNSPGYAYNTPAVTIDNLLSEYKREPKQESDSTGTSKNARSRSPDYSFYTQAQPCDWVIPTFQPKLGEHCCNGAHLKSLHKDHTRTASVTQGKAMF